MIRLMFFARLREVLGVTAEEAVLPAGVGSVAALAAWLARRGDVWAHELAPGRPVRIAVNQEMAGPDTPVRDGDEVAFFPPVTGG